MSVSERDFEYLQRRVKALEELCHKAGEILVATERYSFAPTAVLGEEIKRLASELMAVGKER